MADYVTKIRTSSGDKQIDYNALANLPSVYTKTEIDTRIEAIKSEISPVYAGTTAPTNTNSLWIDTTPDTGGLKYYDGSAWVTVPVRYS